MQTTPLSQEQITRYSRQILLKEIGGNGQIRLGKTTVFILGAGGLGSPIAFYLAAAGVGHLIIADGDRVERSNLQRQILHTTSRIGTFKADSAAETLRALNPATQITSINEKITAESIHAITNACDLVVDASDNFTTRYLLNQACLEAKKTLVSGAVLGFEGQVATFRHGVDPNAPCYQCLYPRMGSEEGLPTCATAGVLGAVAGMVGTIQATEVIKEILGIGTSMAGFVLLINLLDGVFHRVQIQKDPACPICSPA
ncbi:MAG: HesA/MoeB/ThiF family protein [Magnetococcales bacterium]|nr:HesA/MoeB/ThiF family protein [Magnetococcales bacterium]